MALIAGVLAQYGSNDAATLVVLLLMGCAAFALFTGWLAEQQGHPPVPWMFLGFVFNIIALLTIGFAPVRQAEERIPPPG